MSSVQEMHSSKVRPGLSSPLACALFAFERDEGGRVTDMRVLEANEAFLAFSGAEDRGLINEAGSKLFSGSLIPSFKWQEVLFPLSEAGQSPLVLEYLEPTSGFYFRIEAFSLGAGTLTFSCLDVSGDKEEERELRASHQRLVSILDTIPQAVFWKDREGIYRGCNRVFARNIGLEDGQEVIGKGDSELPLPADLAAAYREDDREVLESAQVKAHILEPLVHEGEPCQWLDVTKIPLKNVDGVVDTLLGVYENVTERKLVEDALLESEARLQKSANFLHELVEAIAQPFVVIEAADYRISLANSAAGGSEALGKCCYEHFYHLTTPCRSGGHVCPIERLRTECRSTTVEHVMPDDAGDTRHIQVNAWPMSNGRGQLKRIIVHRMDISERKQVEAELQRSEERFRYLVQHSSDIIEIIDRRGVILFVSDRVGDILGYPPGELTGHNCFSGIHPEDQEAVMTLFTEGLVEIGAIRDIEYRYRHRDGSWVWLHAVGVNHLYNPIIGGVVLNIRDITQARQSREELQAAREAADRANRWKSRFLANMSHEVRTPLNGVLGFTELLSQTPLDDIQQQYVHNVQVSGEALLGIVNDILDFSKIEAGKLELEPVWVALIPLLQDTLDIVRWHADRKGLSLRILSDKHLPRHVFVDPLRLKQILINLLGNAVKFTDRGEVLLCLDFEDGEGAGNALSSGAGRGQFAFAVQDTGMGIPEQHLETIFKAFMQADNSTSRKFGGTGLGLVISNLLARKMGSHIGVESREGEGSRFYFTLELEWREAASEGPMSAESITVGPIATGSTAGSGDIVSPRALNPEASTEGGHSPVRTLRPVVLVAEDVEMNLVLVKTFIRRMRPDVQVIGVADGKAACEVLSEHRVDLIFMDVQMPVMDGLVATAQIRAMEASGKRADGQGVSAADGQGVSAADGQGVSAADGQGVSAADEAGRHVPIVALTAGAIEEEKERALACGMDDFLTKPIDISAFRKSLDRWLPAP